MALNKSALLVYRAKELYSNFAQKLRRVVYKCNI